MLVFIIRRLMQAAVVVLVMASLVFVGVYAIGSPVDILVSPDATQAEIDAVIVRLGLDRPLHMQYLIFMGNLLQGDFGTSFVHGRPAMDVILQRMPATLELSLVAMLMSLFIGVPLGMIAGLMHDKWPGKTIMTGSIIGFSIPNFWLGLMLILVFAVLLGWLPASGRGQTVQVLGMNLSIFTWNGLTHLLLPAFTLALYKISLIIRVARAGTREVMLQDYIKFARAKGVPQHRIILVHILKNISIPVVTVLGLETGSMIAFAVVTETVFAWPGMGKLLIDSILRLDRPVIVAYLVTVVIVFIIINLIVDVLYSILDPRIRLSETN